MSSKLFYKWISIATDPIFAIFSIPLVLITDYLLHTLIKKDVTEKFFDKLRSYSRGNYFLLVRIKKKLVDDGMKWGRGGTCIQIMAFVMAPPPSIPPPTVRVRNRGIPCSPRFENRLRLRWGSARMRGWRWGVPCPQCHSTAPCLLYRYCIVPRLL